MKRILQIITISILTTQLSFAQSDARKILDKMAQTMNSYKTLSIYFEIIHEDAKNKTTEKGKGRVDAKGKDFRQFKVSAGNSDIYCDGTTKWIYLKDAEEINITLADFESEDMNDNPVKFFTVNRKDMKYKFKGTISENQKEMNEVDFYPKDKNAAYHTIRLLIDKKTNEPQSVKYFSKDGNTYTVKVEKIIPNLTFDDNIFKLNVKQYPNIEIVDLR